MCLRKTSVQQLKMTGFKTSKLFLLIVGFFLSVFFGQKLWESAFRSDYERMVSNLNIEVQQDIIKLLSKSVTTKKGKRNYSQLLQTVYQKWNYSLCVNKNDKAGQQHWKSFVPLSKPNETCDDVFTEWLSKNTASSSIEAGIPPKYIPKKLSPLYTMNGMIPVRHWYFDQSFKNDPYDSPLQWTKKFVDEYLNKVEKTQWKSMAYSGDGLNLYTATLKFPPKGQGLIIGSLNPWVEAICVHNGAAHLTTAEYYPIESTHPQLSTINPVDMANSYKKYLGTFDFAASFSSIEHSGLGRFGDNLDPNGDLLEARKVRCFLKPGGIFYLSIPTGTDALFWNAHRIYGHLRYPMMAADFEILGIFQGRESIELKNIDTKIGKHIHSRCLL